MHLEVGLSRTGDAGRAVDVEVEAPAGTPFARVRAELAALVGSPDDAG